jgi:hypothetical protein
MGPFFEELSNKWKELSDEDKAYFNEEAALQNRQTCGPDDTKRVFNDLKGVCRSLCTHQALTNTGNELLILGCSSSDGKTFVIGSSSSVMTYFDKEIEPYAGRMTIEKITEANRKPDANAFRGAVNEHMSNEDIDKNIRHFFHGLYGTII